MTKRALGSDKRKARSAGKKTAVRGNQREASTAVSGEKHRQASWPTSKFAVWCQRYENPNDSNQTFPATVLLRHPTEPFVAIRDKDDEPTLQEVGYSYLSWANHKDNTSIAPPLRLPKEWVDALKPPKPNEEFWWLPMLWPPKKEKETTSFASFRARAERDRSDEIDQIIILLAAPRLMGFRFPLELGIRVVLTYGQWENNTKSA